MNLHAFISNSSTKNTTKLYLKSHLQFFLLRIKESLLSGFFWWYVKVRKSQKQIFVFPFPPNNEQNNTYFSLSFFRAELGKYFVSSFGGNENKLICLWDSLTFIQCQNFKRYYLVKLNQDGSKRQHPRDAIAHLVAQTQHNLMSERGWKPVIAEIAVE